MEFRELFGNPMYDLTMIKGILNCSRNTAKHLLKCGAIEGYKINKQWFCNRDNIRW